MAAVTFFGVTNRVLYKVALVPLHNYVFFLAQLQNVGYLVVYFGVLAWRYRTGKVTADMLAAPKLPFVLIGACEATAQVLFMVGASRLPGAILPVLGQTYLIWNLAFASLILGTRYSKSQIGGAALVMVGVALAALPAHVFQSLVGSGGAVLAAAPPLDMFSVGLCVSCFAFPALANIVKEAMFTSQRKRLGRPLDIFVVNSYGSAAQAFFVLLLLPVTTYLSGIPLAQLPQYLANGVACFLGGAPTCGSVCAGAPELPVAYVVANLAFNIFALTLLRTVGSVTTTILMSIVVPLQILAFVVLPLPYLEAAVLSGNFWWGAAALLMGLTTYQFRTWQPYVQCWLQPRDAGESGQLPKA